MQSGDGNTQEFQFIEIPVYELESRSSIPPFKVYFNIVFIKNENGAFEIKSYNPKRSKPTTIVMNNNFNTIDESFKKISEDNNE